MLRCVLQTPLQRLVWGVVCVVVLVHWVTYHGCYDYEHINAGEVMTLLHKAVNPHLHVTATEECKYDMLQSTRTLHTMEVPNKFDNFSAAGIVNGSYQPQHCKPLFSVAILVPYRNRQEQLDIFVPYIHDFLRRQNIHYKLYVIEQRDEKLWNKGFLYNVGARVAINDKFPCLVLHDVDLLPLDLSNLYVCLHSPRHMSASIDKFRFVLPYTELVGGVASIRSEQYVLVNGFSNSFLGWGGEDDHFAIKLNKHNIHVLRLPRSMSRYTMLVHGQSPRNWQRNQLLEQSNEHAGFAETHPRSMTIVPHRLFTLVAVKI